MDKFSVNQPGSQLKSLLVIAAPISLGMLSQNLMSVIDSLMVSHLGLEALAAISLGGFMIYVANAATVGFSTYVQREAAMLNGAGNETHAHWPLLIALLLAGLFIPAYSALLYFSLPSAIDYFHEDINVLTQLQPYVELRICAIVFVAINFAFRGYYAGIHWIRPYLITILLMHFSNVLLNYILINGKFGMPVMGVSGAGLASLLATIMASLIYFLFLINSSSLSFNRNTQQIKNSIAGIIRVLLPYGIQQMLFVAGFAVMLWIIGRTGTQNLAIAGVILNISVFFFLPAIGMGISAAGRVSHEIGKNNDAEIQTWATLAFKTTLLIFTLISIPLILFPDTILKFYFDEPTVLQAAITPMRIAACMFGLEALSLVLFQLLFAVNNGPRATLYSVLLQWGVFLPTLFFWVNTSTMSLVDIWLSLAAFRFLNILILTMLWKSYKNRLRS